MSITTDIEAEIKAYWDGARGYIHGAINSGHQVMQLRSGGTTHQSIRVQLAETHRQKNVYPCVGLMRRRKLQTSALYRLGLF